MSGLRWSGPTLSTRWRAVAALALTTMAMPALALVTAAPSAAAGDQAKAAAPARTSEASPADATARTVAPGVAILDLDSRRGFLGAPNGEPLAPVMSADGDHAIWQYNNYNGAFGLVWRDLSTDGPSCARASGRTAPTFLPMARLSFMPLRRRRRKAAW